MARAQSYHGNTLGALAVGGNAARRRQFEPLLIGATHVSPCYAYRGLQAGESEAAYGERLAAELESEIRRLDGDKVIAFVAETVITSYSIHYTKLYEVPAFVHLKSAGSMTVMKSSVDSNT